MIDRIGTAPGAGQAQLDRTPPDPASAQAAQQARAAEITGELLKMLEGLKGKPGSVDLRSGPPGAPGLEAPKADFSADELALVLSSLQSKSTEAQLKTAKQGIQISQTQKADTTAQAIEKIREAAAKAAEAAEKEKAGGIFGWISKIAAVVASVVAVVAAAVVTGVSFGAGAPLLALAAVALVTTSIDLANHERAQRNPPAEPISIGGWLNDRFADFLTDVCKMDKEDAKKWAPIVACVAASTFCPAAFLVAPDLVGRAAGAVANLAGGSDKDIMITTMVFNVATTLVIAGVMIAASGGSAAPAALSGTAQAVQTAAKVTQVTAGVVNGAAQIGQGVSTIQAGDLNKDAEYARAAKLDLDKVIAKLSAQMEDERDRVKELLSDLDQSMVAISQMINAASQTRLQQARNIV